MTKETMRTMAIAVGIMIIITLKVLGGNSDNKVEVEAVDYSTMPTPEVCEHKIEVLTNGIEDLDIRVSIMYGGNLKDELFEEVITLCSKPEYKEQLPRQFKEAIKEASKLVIDARIRANNLTNMSPILDNRGMNGIYKKERNCYIKVSNGLIDGTVGQCVDSGFGNYRLTKGYREYDYASYYGDLKPTKKMLARVAERERIDREIEERRTATISHDTSYMSDVESKEVEEEYETMVKNDPKYKEAKEFCAKSDDVDFCMARSGFEGM